MLGQTTKREAGSTKVSAAYEGDPSRMYFALVLLVVALAVILVKDRDFWFGDAETQVADEASPEWVPSRVVQAPAAPAAPAKKPVATPKSSSKPAVAAEPVVATRRTAIPPLEVEVVAGDTRNTVHLSSNSANVELPSDSASEAAGSTAAAAERVQMAVAKVPARPQTVETSYPLLGRQMKVQGSVLLQALIGADGVIQDLRVLSGPAILASAAREAARRWQFKPYLQNGQPVATQANITVNFTIKVLNNSVRDQMDTVVALSRGGE
jgi:periplasmic protein TonB